VGDADSKIPLTVYYIQANNEELNSINVPSSETLFVFAHSPFLFSGSYIGSSAPVLLDQPRFVSLTTLLSARSPSGDDSAVPSFLCNSHAAH
jgi:hypothetical protein